MNAGTGFVRQPQVLVFVPISRSTLCRRLRPRMGRR